jgi:peptidoglycan/LPS O-acetylase OafA/YrhL
VTDSGGGRVRRHNAHLDLVRGVAAIAVCASHLRAFLFVDWPHAQGQNLANLVFYALTGFGHSAVVVFFAMSGYLVGGAVIDARQLGRWSWRDYAIRRMTRLWVVLLPTLLLTWGLDGWGQQLSGGSGYDGSFYDRLSSGPAPDLRGSYSLVTMLGNALFLQMVMVPPFGSNGPLWSLSYEFWYYVMFPLAVGACLDRGYARYLQLALLALLLYALPSYISQNGLIWLFGTSANLLLRSPRVRALSRSRMWLSFSLLSVCSCLVAIRRGWFESWTGTDYVLGAAVALLLLALGVRAHASDLYTRVAHALAELSYTLYLTHFPLLAFVWFSFLAPRQEQPDARGYAMYGSALLALGLYSASLWWMFERRTDRLTVRVRELFGVRSRPDGCAHVTLRRPVSKQ